MYEMFVRVHDVSWEMLGTMSKMILRRAMRTKWMAQAPGGETCQYARLACVGAACSRNRYTPLALTHSELRLGRAAWSLMCSSDSGGSVYIRLLDRLLRAALVSMLEAALSECLLWFGGRFVSPAKLRPEEGCRSVEDSLAVFAGPAPTEGCGIVAVVGALLHRGGEAIKRRRTRQDWS